MRCGKESKKKFEELVKKVWDPRGKTVKLSEADKLPPTSIVTRAFLYHLKDPLKYPILDTNVFKAMRDLDACYKKKTNSNIYNWDKDYMCGYKEFFQKTYKKHKSEIQSLELPLLKNVGREIIRMRVLDRALWEFGRTLGEKKDC